VAVCQVQQMECCCADSCPCCYWHDCRFQHILLMRMQAHPHITAVTCDLPAVHSTAVSYVEQHKLQDRVEVSLCSLPGRDSKGLDEAHGSRVLERFDNDSIACRFATMCYACCCATKVLDLDMFDERQQWPKADVIAMGMVLHDCEYHLLLGCACPRAGCGGKSVMRRDVQPLWGLPCPPNTCFNTHPASILFPTKL
jgi:hypothetical protein